MPSTQRAQDQQQEQQERQLLRDIQRETDRLGLSTIELAALSGISAPIALAVKRGKLPAFVRTRNGLVKFLERARGSSRTALGLP